MPKLTDPKPVDPKLVDRGARPTGPVVVAPPPRKEAEPEARSDSGFYGARKLIRPRLPAFLGGRREPVHTEDPLTHALNDGPHAPEASHAEVFYFQKQIQQATEMTFVLDDGEELHGVIEWFDRCSLKLRLHNRNRVLVYKSCIKYLFKSSELAAANSIMK